MTMPNSNNLPDRLYTARDCREIDARVINHGQVSGYELMTKAGQFTFNCVLKYYSQIDDIAIVCGRGNNGGDGYVIAALAASKGIKVKIFSLGEPATHDARKAFEFARQQDCEIIDCTAKPDLSTALDCAQLIIDAMLGTGVDRDIEGYLGQMVDWINASKRPVLACDVPTGLHSDCGRIMGKCVRAERTVTFIALKAGLFTAQGKAQSGQVEFSDLDVDAQFYQPNTPHAKLLNRTQISQSICPRQESAHKGTTGYSVIAGGAPGMMGAVLMAAKAAYRVGCGRVQVVTHHQHRSLLALNCPEVLTWQGDDACAEYDLNLGNFNALAIGPGLGQGQWGKKLYSRFMQSNLPMVVDADGLNLLAHEQQRRENWVLTPHPGEAASLLGCHSSDVQFDRYSAVKQIVKQYGGVCVLKGSGSLIAAKNRFIRVCNAGNSGQATAGMGDVLTGCITGLIAQGYDLFDAAIIATWLHASAADCVAEESGKIGIMATDLLLPIKSLHNNL